MMILEELFCHVDDVLIQSLQVGKPAQRAESLFVRQLNILGIALQSTALSISCAD